MLRYRWIILLAFVLAVPGFAAYEPDPQEDDYSTGDYGRIRLMDDEVELQRADDEDAREAAAINAPIFPGDSLLTGDGSRAEIELAAGNVIWFDGDSSLRFMALPSPYAETEDRTVLQLTNGTIRIERPRRAEGDFRVDSPFGTVWISEGSDVRLETDGRDQLLVYVFRGTAGISTDSSERRLEAGERTTAFEGGKIDRVYVFNTTLSDRFDEWVLDRRDILNTYARSYDDDDIDLDEVYDEVPGEIRPYWRELNRNGRWIYDDSYGYVWSPTGVAQNWRPYNDGHWSYGTRGYFWVANEPWGWAPYRYGRWSYLSGYGWCWAPGRVFGGAWVSWSWGSAYIGWSPLNYWNQPAYYGQRYYNYYDPYCWNFISYSHFGYHSYRHVYVPVHHIGNDLHRSAVVTRAPRVAPARLAGSRLARERAVEKARNSHTRIDANTLEARDSSRRFRETERATRKTAVRNAKRDELPGRDRKSGVATSRVQVEERSRRRDAGTKSENGRTALDRQATRNANGSPRATERSTETRRTDETKERTRDLYRRMTAPRETRPRTEKPSRPVTVRDRQVRPTRPSRDSTAGSKSQVRPSRPAPARDRQVRPTTPSRGSSSGSRPKAQPRKSGTSSKPQARPSRGSSSGSRPKAQPRKSGSGSKPQARPSRGSSSGSKPKAQPRKSGSGKRKSSRSKASRGS